MFYRRHHCRLCGLIMCKACAFSFQPLPDVTVNLPPGAAAPPPLACSLYSDAGRALAAASVRTWAVNTIRVFEGG